MIGTNSITQNFIIPNSNSKPSWEVIVQVNKNGGICDFILPKKMKEPKKVGETYNGVLVRGVYNAVKKEYDEYMKKYLAIRSELFNNFQGRQLETVEVQIYEFLYSIK